MSFNYVAVSEAEPACLYCESHTLCYLKGLGVQLPSNWGTFFGAVSYGSSHSWTRNLDGYLVFKDPTDR